MSNIGAEPDPTSVIRVYCKNIQRVKGSYMELNSHASFVVYSDRQCAVAVWHGRFAKKRDRKIAIFLGEQTKNEMKGTLSFTDEATGDEESRKLFLSLLWLTEKEYSSSKLEDDRIKSISNSPKVLYKIHESKMKKYVVQKIDSVKCASDGTVSKFIFDQINSPVGIFAVVVDNQWDLWIGENVGANEETVARYIATDLATTRNRILEFQSGLVLFAESIRVVRQGYERAVFRGNFEDHTRLGYRLLRRVDVRCNHYC